MPFVLLSTVTVEPLVRASKAASLSLSGVWKLPLSIFIVPSSVIPWLLVFHFVFNSFLQYLCPKSLITFFKTKLEPVRDLWRQSQMLSNFIVFQCFSSDSGCRSRKFYCPFSRRRFGWKWKWNVKLVHFLWTILAQTPLNVYWMFYVAARNVFAYCVIYYICHGKNNLSIYWLLSNEEVIICHFKLKSILPLTMASSILFFKTAQN